MSLLTRFCFWLSIWAAFAYGLTLLAYDSLVIPDMWDHPAKVHMRALLWKHKGILLNPWHTDDLEDIT